MKNTIINNQKIGFEVANNEVYATSLDIAKVFNKRHDNIISKIKMLPQDNFCLLNFKETERSTKITASEGYKKDKYYLLTRDAFSLLVMGFTGKKAYEWKIAFINAFNQMEKALRNKKPISSKSKYKKEYEAFEYPFTYGNLLVAIYATIRLQSKIDRLAKEWNDSAKFIESRINSVSKRFPRIKEVIEHAKEVVDNRF